MPVMSTPYRESVLLPSQYQFTPRLGSPGFSAPMPISVSCCDTEASSAYTLTDGNDTAAILTAVRTLTAALAR